MAHVRGVGVLVCVRGVSAVVGLWFRIHCLGFRMGSTTHKVKKCWPVQGRQQAEYQYHGICGGFATAKFRHHGICDGFRNRRIPVPQYLRWFRPPQYRQIPVPLYLRRLRNCRIPVLAVITKMSIPALSTFKPPFDENPAGSLKRRFRYQTCTTS